MPLINPMNGNAPRLAGNLLLGGLLLLLLVLVASDPFMLNNNDYHRTLRGVIELAFWQEPAPALPFTNAPLYPASSMSLLFMLLAGLHKLLGFSEFHVRSMALVLYAIMATGALLAVAEDRRSLRLIIPVLLLGLVLSGFTSSFYEEAILLPLLPWLVFGWLRMRAGKGWLVFTGAAALILLAKMQMMVFLPLLLWLPWQALRAGRLSWAGMAASVAAMLLAVALINVLKHGNSNANAYNRCNNGLGWALQSVQDWPVNSFKPRFDYFYANQASLQARSLSYEQNPQQPLLGTAYWPTGKAVLQALPTGQQMAFRKSCGNSSYAGMLMQPEVALHFTQTLLAIFTGSDYALQYITSKQLSPWQQLTIGARQLVLQHAGMLYLLLAVLCIIGQPWFRQFFLLGFFAGLPLVVVAGDGFFEFEKHMLTYFMSIPLLLLLRREWAACADPRNTPKTTDGMWRTPRSGQ